MNRQEPMIQVKNLVTQYGEQRVLDDISFDVYPKEIVVVLGGSGCGKTTLLKTMVGLLPPLSGSILYTGRDITRMDEDKMESLLKKIGIAFQGGALFNSLTVAENISLPIEEYGGVDSRLTSILAEMKLSLVGLGSAGLKLPDELSGGMKKRVGFARAIALDPEIVFFDEPSAGLDPIMAAGIDKLILEIRGLLNTTMIVVTHELASIRTVADRVIMLDRGKIIFQGTVKEAESCAIQRVRQFFERKPDESIQQPVP